MSQCIESVLCQTFRDFQLILIDDGSPDRSGEICDSYAQADDRICVVHKPNGGLSDARNVGISYAKGEYVLFLDSDDWWGHEDDLSLIDNALRNDRPDILLFGVKKVFMGSDKTVVRYSYLNKTGLNKKCKKELLDQIISDGVFPGGAWMLAIRRDFIINNDLYFKKGVTAEDYDWLIKCCIHASNIKLLDRIIYQYRCNVPGSLSDIPRLSSILGMHNAIDNWLKSPDKQNLFSITEYVCRIFIILTLTYGRLPDVQRHGVKTLLLSDKKILDMSRSLKNRLIGLLIDAFGIDVFATLLTLLYRIYRH